ncbi:MAG: glycosyltransferase, partial [Anaerolineales bacterium]|nr:glycosyltransferase [Anaerolineales bacterium]
DGLARYQRNQDERKEMKIALITNSRIPSLTANSIQAMKVAQALIQLGYDLKIFAPAESDPAPEATLRAHYGLRDVPPIELIPSLKFFRRVDFILRSQLAAEQFGAELIYTWLPQSAALALTRKFPVVLEMHADVAGKMGAWWLRQFVKINGRKLITTTNIALKKILERSIQLPITNYLVAPNGVELEKYQNLPTPSEARKRLNLKENLTVGFTGHIYAGRGAELLFELAKSMPAVNFLWVGGTPDLVEFWRGKCSEAQMNNVTMTGFAPHEQVPLYQAASDVLLMPYSRSISASSGQDIAEVINPMKMFEYMAAGRAIVSADLPSIREILNEGNAALCEPSNIETWKTEIENLLADEPRRAALGAQARKDVERFTWTEREKRVMGHALTNSISAGI